MRIVQIILFLVMVTLCAELRFEGFVPSGLDTGSLNAQYRRIRSVLQPSSGNYTMPVVITYYRHGIDKILGVRLPEWGGGGAIGYDSIIIPVNRNYAFYNSDYWRITLHELVHIAITRSYGHLRVPRWFHEGVAMALSGELSFDENVILSRAILTNSIMPLDSIERLNRFSSSKAQLAYCQSHFAVGFLIDTYGYDLLPELLYYSQSRRSFQDACLEVFGLQPFEFENLLHKEMKSRYKFLFLISDYSLLWIFLSLVTIAAFVLTILRNRSRGREMEQQEELSLCNENKDE